MLVRSRSSIGRRRGRSLLRPLPAKEKIKAGARERAAEAEKAEGEEEVGDVVAEAAEEKAEEEDEAELMHRQVVPRVLAGPSGTQALAIRPIASTGM